jgi:hypothetical protein
MVRSAGHLSGSSEHLMPLVGDDDRIGERPAAKDMLGVFGELDEVQDARHLPAIVVGLVLAIPIFVAIAIALAIVVYGAYQIFRPTGPIASALGLIWFGGSLALTALAVRPLLRRLNAILAGRGWPTLY